MSKLGFIHNAQLAEVGFMLHLRDCISMMSYRLNIVMGI